MARISIVLVAALAVAVVADPIRQKRQNNLITSAGQAAVAGSGWAGDNHAAAINAIGIPSGSGSGWGDSGWSGVPASISMINVGGSEVAQGASIAEATVNTPEDLSAIQLIDVAQDAYGGDDLAVVASGGEADLASSSNAAASGWGAIGAEGSVDITSDGASSLGMASP